MQIRIVYKLQTSPDSAWRSGWTATTEAVAPTKRSSVGLPEFFLGRPSHGRTCWGCGAADGSSIFLNSHECPMIWNNHELLLIGVYCISEQSNGRQLQEVQVCNCDWFGIRVVLPSLPECCGTFVFRNEPKLWILFLFVLSNVEERLCRSHHRTEVWYQDIAYSVWYTTNTLKHWQSQ